MNTTMVNAKSTKEEIVRFIKSESSTKKLAQSLKDSISYTLKKYKEDIKSVSKTDLMSLVKDIVASPTVAVETSPKIVKSSKTKGDKSEPAPEKESKPAIKKSPDKAKKIVDKKAEDDHKVTKALVKSTNLPQVIAFPETIQHKELGLLTRATDLTDMDKIREAVEKGETLIIASYWTKREIAQLDYAGFTSTVAPKNGFPDDIDTLQVIYACSGVDLLYAISTYTEAMFLFHGESFNPVEDETSDGEVFSMKYENTMEFEIYRAE